MALIGMACLLLLTIDRSEGGTCQQMPATASVEQQNASSLLRVPADLIAYLQEGELANGPADTELRVPGRLLSHLQSGDVIADPPHLDSHDLPLKLEKGEPYNTRCQPAASAR